MKKNLFWIVVGGLAFWAPFFGYTVALRDNADDLVSNVLALVGVILLIVATWVVTKRFPRWLWVLAGIYILGPVSMIAAAGLYIHDAASAMFNNVLVDALCLFPPMTLWFATLDGMIFSVLIVTVLLTVFAALAPEGGGRNGATRAA